MRQNKKGSILLYVLFLSSFLALFFVSFQGEMENILEGTKDSGRTIQETSGIRDALMLLRNAPADSMTIASNNNPSLVSLIQTGNIFQETLRSDETREYWITSSGGSATLGLDVTAGGPIDYRLIAFNSGSEVSAVKVDSGVTSNNVDIMLSTTKNTHILFIDPLGGGVSYNLDARNTILIPESVAYRLHRDTNGFMKDEGIYRVDHFQPKTRQNIDWTTMGLYLKQ